MTWDRLDAATVLIPTITESLEVSAASGRDWDHGSHDDVKALLKTALFTAQEFQCAYCRREIQDESGRVEIDHVLPKAPSRFATHVASNDPNHRRSTTGYPRFKFSGPNLVLACKRCNNKKGNYDSRTDRALAIPATYPEQSEAFLWVHPYLHDYSAHIELALGYVFRVMNNSEGGRAVITACGLNTLAAVEAKAISGALKGLPNVERALIRIWDRSAIDNIQAAAALVQRFPQLDQQNVADVLARHGRDLEDLVQVAEYIKAMMP